MSGTFYSPLASPPTYKTIVLNGASIDGETDYLGTILSLEVAGGLAWSIGQRARMSKKDGGPINIYLVDGMVTEYKNFFGVWRLKIYVDYQVTGIGNFENALVNIGGEPGASGGAGATGASGVGVPTGGNTGQILSKIDNDDYNLEYINPQNILFEEKICLNTVDPSFVNKTYTPSTQQGLYIYMEYNDAPITLTSWKLNGVEQLVSSVPLLDAGYSSIYTPGTTLTTIWNNFATANGLVGTVIADDPEEISGVEINGIEGLEIVMEMTFDENGTTYTRYAISSLNYALSTTTVDRYNPTNTEVQTWVNANLNSSQLKNGTQITYFIDSYSLPQSEIYIGPPLDSHLIITSFTLNGDEIIVTPIELMDAGSVFTYTRQLKPLVDAWLLANDIEAYFNDVSLRLEEKFIFSNIIGDLSVEITYTSDGAPSTVIDSSLNVLLLGDGGNCDQPDFIWVLNEDNEVTLSHKRGYTSKTVYVDAYGGSNVSGKRGYMNFPFQTVNAAVAVLESGDKLIIGEGNYTWSSSLPVLEDISVEAKGNITKNNIFITTSTDSTNRKLTFKCDDLTGQSGSSITFLKNTFVDFFVKTFNWTSTFHIGPQVKGNITINNLIKTETGSLFFINSWEDYLNININNYTYTNFNTSGYQFFIISWEQSTTYDVLDKTGSRLTLNIKNYTANAYLSGLWGSYDTTGKTITNHQWIVNVNNVKQVGWNSGITNYYGLVYDDRNNTNYSGNIMTFNLFNVNIDYPLFYRRRGSSCDFIFNIEYLKINYSSLLMTSSSTAALLNSNLIYNVKIGIVYTLFDFNANHTTSTTLTNSTIIIAGNFTTNTNVTPRFILDATSKLIFKGRFNLGDKKFDLSNISGAGADNIYFDNCTIITSGTNCIDAGSAKNIKIMNTYSNKATSANITSLIESVSVDLLII